MMTLPHRRLQDKTKVHASITLVRIIQSQNKRLFKYHWPLTLRGGGMVWRIMCLPCMGGDHVQSLMMAGKRPPLPSFSTKEVQLSV